MGPTDALVRSIGDCHIHTLETESPLTLPVSELNLFIRDWIESCPPFSDIWVTGEISNYRRFASGSQRYFSLNDGDSTIQCVIFDAGNPRFEGPYADGVAVLARGKVRFFNRKGTVQFQINYIMPKGSGSVRQNIEELKRRLTREGLFNPEYKTGLPKLPASLGLITAKDSAAAADVIRLLAEHAPFIRVVMCPATMQGMACVPTVIDAIDRLEDYSVDVILVARGGGSFEDLLPFSDERLLRRVTQTSIPVVTAIGHEIDAPLIDLAADRAFPTPSAAALALAETYRALPSIVSNIQSRLHDTITRLHETHNTKVQEVLQDLRNQLSVVFDKSEMRLSRIIRDLELLSPLRKLSQGFSISRLHSGAILRSTSLVKAGDAITTQVSDGVVVSEVKKVI